MPDIRRQGPEAFRKKVNGKDTPRSRVVMVSYDDLDTEDEVIDKVRAQIGPGGTVDKIDFDSTVANGRKILKRVKVTYRTAGNPG